MTDEQKQNWQDIFADHDRTIKTYDTMYALHTLAEYWIENENIIEQAAVVEAEKNTPNWTPDYNDESSVAEFCAERDTARYMHDDIMIPMHRYSCAVMLFTTAERELLRLVENLEKEHGQQKLKWKDIRANGTLERISKFCEVFFNFRLADCSQYAALTDLQKIRDCIIHCFGDVSLSSDKDFLVTLQKKRRDFFAYAPSQIYIGEECIKQFLKEIWEFFLSIFNVLGWEIAKHWQGDKLEKIFEKLKK